MNSWVSLFSRFTPEALLFESLLICGGVAVYCAFWVIRKRRLGSVEEHVPAGLVKQYLSELIQQAEGVRSQLFGLLADHGVATPASPAGLQADQLTELLKKIQIQNTATTPAPQAAAPSVDDVVLQQKLVVLEAKLHEQAQAMNGLTAEKNRLQAELEAAKVASQNAVPGAAAPSGDSGELQKKIQMLEERLAEYSVIEDDLANLKKLQQENTQLRSLLNQNGNADAAAAIPVAQAVTTPAPTAAAAPAATPIPATTEAPVTSPTANAAFEATVDQVEKNIAAPTAQPAVAQPVSQPTAATPPPAAQPAVSTPAAGAATTKSDEDLLSEFEKMLQS
jgi:hypothetical protein